MELLDRYLEAVRKHLPWKRQDDILAELKANLEAQLEDREAELGRPLTLGESEDWLRELGSPIQVAAHYQPQQYLIGPRLFPIYTMVLRTALAWLAAIYIIIWTVTMVATAHGIMPVVDLAVNLPFSLFISAAAITAVFAVVEFLTLHFPERFSHLAGKVDTWSPADLPPLPDPGRSAGKPRSLASAIAELVLSVIFLVWWLMVPKYPFLMLGPGSALWYRSPFECAPILVFFYWWVAAMTLLQVAWRAIDLARGAWSRKSEWEARVSSLLGLIPVILLVTAPGHVYLRLKDTQIHAIDPGKVEMLNRFMHFAFSVMLAATLLHLAWEGVKFGLNVYRQRGAAH